MCALAAVARAPALPSLTRLVFLPCSQVWRLRVVKAHHHPPIPLMNSRATMTAAPLPARVGPRLRCQSHAYAPRAPSPPRSASILPDTTWIHGLGTGMAKCMSTPGLSLTKSLIGWSAKQRSGSASSSSSSTSSSVIWPWSLIYGHWWQMLTRLLRSCQYTSEGRRFIYNKLSST